jgi:uncharacterized cupredoxin-like copper-binding protein
VPGPAPRRVLLALVVTAALVGVSPTSAAHRNRAVTIDVTAGKPSEFKFMLSPSKTVKKGTTVTFVVTNLGTLAHTFKIAGKRTPLLKVGRTATLVVAFSKAGRYPYRCTISGHAAAGMKGVLVVK